MSDDVEFRLLTRSLEDQELGRRVVRMNRVRRSASVTAVCLGLIALALVMALTNTASLVITLAVVTAIGVEVARLGLRGTNARTASEKPSQPRAFPHRRRRPGTVLPGRPTSWNPKLT